MWNFRTESKTCDGQNLFGTQFSCFWDWCYISLPANLGKLTIPFIRSVTPAISNFDLSISCKSSRPHRFSPCTSDIDYPTPFKLCIHACIIRVYSSVCCKFCIFSEEFFFGNYHHCVQHFNERRCDSGCKSFGQWCCCNTNVHGQNYRSSCCGIYVSFECS